MILFQQAIRHSQSQRLLPTYGLPVRTSSLTRTAPTKACSLLIPPAPDTTGNLVSGNRISGLPTTRMCAASASSNPPPKAGAAIAAITGIGKSSNDLRDERRRVRKTTVSASVKDFRSFRSAPAQKHLSSSEATMSARVVPKWLGDELGSSS
ncbi:hypothetical protein WAI453_001514 [Rhynchosporium graminicola]